MGKKSHFVWGGYPNMPSEQEMVDKMAKQQKKKVVTPPPNKKKDKGFYGHTKCQTLF